MTSRILDGVSGTWQFCVNRSTRHTYIFDVASEVFHVGDPEKKLNVRIVPFAIRQHLKRRVGGSGGGPCKWIGLASIDRYILAFVFDQRNARYYLISFVDNGEQIEIADQCDIGIERMIELSYTSFSRDESDRLYCIVCANISGIRSKTIYHLARVNINATNGQISTETLVSNQSIDGLWYKPFVYRNAIVFRQGLHRLFRISIDSTENKSALIRQIDPCSSNSVWFGPVIYRQHLALYYVYDRDRCVGCVWMLNLSECTLAKTPMAFSRHALAKFTSVDLCDDRLLMHGECSLATCKTRAHVHVVNLKEKLKE